MSICKICGLDRIGPDGVARNCPNKVQMSFPKELLIYTQQQNHKRAVAAAIKEAADASRPYYVKGKLFTPKKVEPKIPEPEPLWKPPKPGPCPKQPLISFAPVFIDLPVIVRNKK